MAHYRFTRGETNHDDCATPIPGRRECCDDSAGADKIIRRIHRVTLRGEERGPYENGLVLGLWQASSRICSKGSTRTRHIDGLFQMMRILGLILIFDRQAFCTCLGFISDRGRFCCRLSRCGRFPIGHRCCARWYENFCYDGRIYSAMHGPIRSPTTYS